MVTLRLLGGVSLDAEEGPVTGRSAQRRRLALLALLSRAGNDPVSRDKVVGYLWPETGDEKARRLLSESLYVIRRELGQESVLAEGDELRLNPDVVWTDASAFLEAMGRGELVGAVELYRGPFMDGFYLKEAPEFERWVEGERGRLERRFAEALRLLATRAEAEEGESAAAVWWRRLAELDPYDTATAVGYMRALEASGQRAAALQHAQLHAALLREAFDAEPDPEVERLAARLRDEPRPSVRVPDGPEENALPSGGPSDPQSEPPPTEAEGALAREGEGVRVGRHTGPGTGPFLPPFLRRIPVILGSLAVVLAVGLVWFRIASGPSDATGPRPGTPPGEAVIAVLPFTVQGEVGATLREGGLATLLNINLDGVDGLRTVDQDALWYFLGRPGPGDVIRPEEALRAARHFGAGSFIQGRMVGAEDGEVRVAASLHTVDSMAREPLDVVVDGRSDDPMALADSLTIRLLGGLQEVQGERLSGLAARTSPSITALNAYLEGEEAFRATRYGRAREAFQAAVEEDEDFTLAHYRRSIAALLDLRFAEARLSAERAVQSAGRLSPRDRRLVHAWDALMAGEAEAAERDYLEILGDYPDEVEALFGLGEVRIFYNPVRGLSPEAARGPLEQALVLNPGLGQARFHLLELAVGRGDTLAFDTLYPGVDPASDQALVWETVRAFWQGGEGERRAAEARLRSADPVVVGLAAARVAAHLQDYRAAERLAGILSGPDRDAESRAAAGILTAMMRFARGAWEDGMRALGEASELDPAWSLELRALYTGYPFRPLPPETTQGIRAELQTWPADAVGPSGNFVLFAHNGFHTSLRLYLLALTSLWAGEPGEALRFSGDLERVHRGPENMATDAAWARSIRARVAAAQGRTEEAARLLEGARLRAPLERIAISPFFSRAFDRYFLGELLAQEGRTEEALAWFQSLTEGYELVLAAPAHLQMGRILETQGDTQAAARHYRRVLDLWSEPDEVFQPLVEEARSRLGTGTGEGAGGGG